MNAKKQGMRVMRTGLLVALMVGGGLAYGASSVPFADTFDYPDGTSLDGTNGWSVSGSGTVTATNGVAQIVNTDTNVTLSNTFDDGELAVSMAFDMKPVYTDGDPAGSFPTDATFVFYVDTNGMINAYDGASVTALTHDAVSDQFTTNFQVDVDYVVDRWSLSVGGVEVATDLDFYSASHATFGELAFTEVGASATSIVDNVDIQSAVPATTTTTTTVPTTTTTTVAATTTTTTTAVPGSRPIPFADGFEDYVLGSTLNGKAPTAHPTMSWAASNVTVTNTPTSGGTQSAALTASDASAVQTFNDGQTDVWTDLYIQPAFGQPDEAPPAGSSFAFYVQTNGQVVAYDGSTETQLVGVAITSNTWVRFTVHSDYAVTNWTLYVNGSELAAGLDFYDPSAASFSEFGVKGGGSGGAFMDDVRIQTATPLSDVPLVSFATGVAYYDEVVTAATVSVTLDRVPTNTVQVNHFRIGGSAGVGSDFTDYTAGTLTFSPGQTSTSFTFTVVDDTEEELAETIVFGLNNPVNGAAGTYTNFTYTINASDGTGDTNAWYQLPFYEPFEVRDLGDLDGQRGWVASNAVVQSDVVRAGTKAATLEIGTPEAHHEFRDGKTDVWTDLYIQPAFGDLSVTNPPADASFVFYVQTNGQVVAYDGAIETQLVHNALSEGEWVRFTVHSDYTSKTWDLYIDGVLAGEALGFHDTSAGSYTEFGVRGADRDKVYLDDVRIQETAPSLAAVEFEQTAGSGEESVGLVTVPVTLNAASTEEVRVDHFLVGGTADFGADFTNYTSGTLVFAPGQTSTSITFTVIDDDEPDPDETVILGLRNAVNAEAWENTNFTYTILYELLDETPVVSFETFGVRVDAGVSAAVIPVTLWPAQVATVTVDHAVLPESTATYGSDYTNYTAGTLTFLPGVTNQSITFTVIDNSEAQDEQVVLELSDFVNAEAGLNTTFTYTIGGDSSVWYELPFSDTFDVSVAGALAPQLGWSSSTATVQTDVVYSGSKAVRVNSGVRHTFSDAQTDVWTDLWIKPLFGENPGVPGSSTFAFYFDEGGDVWAYDGDTDRRVSPDFLRLREGRWTRFTIHSDYARKRWHLYIGGLLVAPDLRFYSESVTGYSEFGVRARTTTNAPYSSYLDNVRITLTRPAMTFDSGSVLIVR